MKKSIVISSLLSLFLFASCNTSPEGKPGDISIESAEGDKVLLRLKPKVGDTQKGIMTMSMSASGDEEMNLKMNYDLTISAFKDSLYTYDVQYNSVQMDVNMGNGISMSYNSNDQTHEGFGEILHQSMSEILANPVSMKMDEMGRIAELNLLGIEANQQADLGSMLIPLPQEPVGINDSWTSEKKVEGMGVLKMTMTLKEILIDEVLIGTKGTIENNGSSIGDFEGEYRLLRNNGLTKDGTMNLKAKTKGQNIKMKINYKTL